MVGFAVAERNFIAHDLVFYRVLEWGVQKHINLLALDESHFDDSLSEATVTGYLDDDSTFTCFKF